MTLQTANLLDAGTDGNPVPDLAWYDILLFSSSGGKDSQAALDRLVELARAAGVVHRIVVFHADLEEIDWPGTAELAAEHAAHYGLRFEKASRYTREGVRQNLLEQIEARGRFPDRSRRFCSSDHKRGPFRTVLTWLVAELRTAGLTTRPVRVLSIMGHRAEESAERALKKPFRHDEGKNCPCAECRSKDPAQRRNGASNTRRHVDEWFPVFKWKVADVWERIEKAGTRAHWAYEIGLPRLSCRFCVLAPTKALVLSAQFNPDLARRYAEVEQRIGHTFKVNLSMREIIRLAEEDDEISGVPDWAG